MVLNAVEQVGVEYGQAASILGFGAEYGLGAELGSSSTIHRSALLITEVDDTSSATFHLEDADFGDYFVISVYSDPGEPGASRPRGVRCPPACAGHVLAMS